MKPFPCVPLTAGLLLSSASLLFGASLNLPLEIHQDNTTYNLQSQRGVPISVNFNPSIGSDGRMTTTNESFGSLSLPTANQFSGLISFGGTPGLALADWQTVSNSTLINGTNVFSPIVAAQMKLPVARSNSQDTASPILMVLRRAQIGAPYLSRQVSFLFGSLVSVPQTDERGVLLTNIVSTAYWLAEPYSTNLHADTGYYWSPHARQVFAIQAGPIKVTWRKATPYTSANLPLSYTNVNGTATFETNGGSIYILYTAQYVISGSTVKPPRKMYWTERSFRAVGKPIAVPAARVGALNIIYNSTFPRTVANEYVGPGQTSPTDGTTNQVLQELRTLWYDQQQGSIYAYNLEGRAFVELLGDARPDGQTREPLGNEIVEVFKQANPLDVSTELGERLLPPPPGSVTNLFPEPVAQTAGPAFTYQHNVSGSDDVELFATRETANLNDYMVHWMEEGLVGLRWPSLFARYRLAWPTDVTKYSHYVRPLVATENEARETAVPLATDNVPLIEYQDPFDRPRAKLTEDFKFYTFLSPTYPAHRTLLRFTAGENVAFERVFSWLDTTLTATNFGGTVAANLSAWNPTNSTVTWANDLTAPRVVHQTVSVGERISAPAGERGAADGEAYLAGHIHLPGGTLFNVNAYVDPFSAGFDVANQGAIIPVNAMPGTNRLEVWWFRQNAADTTIGFKPLYWPAAIGHYTIEWPGNPREIVLASLQGSGAPANSLEAQGTIYSQNDPALPGYNPNEEHAIMSGGTAFATRDDLNITNSLNYSSHPFVLVDYVAEDGRPSMAVYKVLREKPEAGILFDYIVEAGKLLQPPPPLGFLGKPVEGSGDNAINYNTEPTAQNGDLPGAWLDSRDANGVYGHYKRFTYRDRHHDFWVYRGLHAGLPALQTGTYVATNRTFVAISNASAIVGQPFNFSLHASRQDEFLALTLANANPQLGWLRVNANGLSISGTPGTNHVGTNTVQLVVEDLYDHARVTNNLTIRVLNSGSVIAQGPLQILSTNSYTGSIAIFSNRAPFLASSPEPANSFTMRYYYKTEPGFDWPGVANPPPPGSIVPYLRRYRGGLFEGDSASKTSALDIVYRPVWPVRDPADSSKPVPSLPFGATLTKPKFGLPGVRDWKTAHILYQQSIATDIVNANVSAVLHDATREKSSALGDHQLTRLPAGVRAELYQGKYFFPNLPPHLAARLFFDPNRSANGSVVLKGEWKNETFGEEYTLLNVLRGSDLAAAKALCPTADFDYPKWAATIDDLATAIETFYEDPNQPGNYIPNPALTVFAGEQDLAVVTNDNTAVDSYALSATGPGSGYITLLEASGTAFTQPGDPVAMHIFKVSGELYRGELKVIPASNPLSEQVSFQHTADLAGRSGEYEYQWKIAAPVDGTPPLSDATMSRYLSLTNGVDVPRYTLGGAGVQALADNYLTIRYRPINPAHPLYRQNPTDSDWSDWTTPKLAEGWIKRVLGGINPFNQRVSDLFNNRVNTDASILTQAGHRWEGDVALNLETINNFGLIEIYETVLRRGRMLSIESGFNYGPANDALLLAAGYLDDLYLMLGNEAWADAANPTIGIGTKDNTYGDVATALFAFKGQVPSLLEEELALLRGRDDFLQPGVEVAPVYNRLVWNYTRGIDAGEVIYALNYNIQENPNQTPDGVIDAEDAARMFPQGHGDAYGHYLTGLKGYYSLLLNNSFDWVPRTEAVNVLGQPVQIDYQDERKFAASAAAVARAGRQVFDLTWRRDYQQVHSVGWEHLGATRHNTQRAVPTTRYWGTDHWASRTGQGAYLNWIVGNAILPDIDPNPAHEGIQKIDRTTVPELLELASLADGLQTALDQAEGGLSPLGLPEGGLAFDINPTTVVGDAGQTHFDQIYDRAKAALNNAVASFDDAKDVTRLMRSEQDSLAEFQAGVARQELAYQNSLIELYGTPYPDDVGPGKTYKQGYNGPDLIHFSYVDNVELTAPGLLEPTNSAEFKIDIQKRTTDYLNGDKTRFDFIVQAIKDNPDYIENTNYISFTLASSGFFQKPVAWSGQRPSPGKIQEAISRILLARNAALAALKDDELLKYKLDRSIELFQAKLDTDEDLHQWDTDKAATQTAIQSALFAAKMWVLFHDTFTTETKDSADAMLEAIPKGFIAGLAVGGDTLSAARGAVLAAYAVTRAANNAGNLAKEFVTGGLQLSRESFLRQREADFVGPLTREQENRNIVVGLDAALSDLQLALFTINQRLQELDGATRQYQSLIAEGDRIQQEREIYRQRSSAVIQGFRTRDAAFRIFRNEKLERYKTLFDLSARYALLAANAYDYETGLLNTPAGRSFVNRIVSARALGVVRQGEPQFAGSDAGDPGLSSALAEMKADWEVLRGRLGFNNPDAYGTTVSLRTENFRILPTADGSNSWVQILQQARKADVLEDADLRRHCMQISRGDGLPVPGIVLTFSTTITDGNNLFGQPLAAGDHAFSPSSFATKIFAVGVALVGYRGMDEPSANGGAGGTSPPDPNTWYLDPLGLSATPYVYLVPVGVDVLRSPPLGDASELRSWAVDDVAIPMPFNIGASDFSTQALYQSSDSLTEPLFGVRKHQAFRPVPRASLFSTSLYGEGGTLLRTQYTNNRLVARSVWNTQWKLVIPGHTLLNDPNEGLDRFIQTVSDIKLHFVTYSYSGN